MEEKDTGGWMGWGVAGCGLGGKEKEEWLVGVGWGRDEEKRGGFW